MRRALTLVAALGLATAAIAWQQTVNQLQQDGKTISTNLRIVDGTLMVPVKDVAAYLGGNLTVANGTATISGSNSSSIGGIPALNGGSSAGGNVRDVAAGATPGTFPGMGAFTSASQPFATENVRPQPVEKTAKIGDAVDSDGFTFTVLGVDDVSKGDYRTQYDPRHRKISTSLRDDRLVVVRVRVENASDQTRRPSLPVSRDMTLFDENGVGVPAVAFDARPIDAIDDLGLPTDFVESPLLAPKGAMEFAVVFSVPKDRSAKRLAVGLPPNSTDSGGTNLRIDL